MSGFMCIISFLLFPASLCLAALKYMKRTTELALFFFKLRLSLSSHCFWFTLFGTAFLSWSLGLCFPLCQCSFSCDAQTGSDGPRVLWTIQSRTLPRNELDIPLMWDTHASAYCQLHLNTSQHHSTPHLLFPLTAGRQRFLLLFC